MAGELEDYLYPQDDFGTAITNKVTLERKTLNPPSEVDHYHFILPAAAPYYRDTMKLRHISSNRVLVRGVDWTPGHRFESASYETENVKGGIYGSIMFYDMELSGQVELTEYQTLGGNWTLSENQLLEIASNRLQDPRTVSYEQVNGKPDVFPPTGHNHPSEDFTGMLEAIMALAGVEQAIRERTEDWLANPPVMFELYYFKTQVDALLAALNARFLNYDTSAVVDQKIAAALAGGGGGGGGGGDDYYTKAQVNALIANLTNQINNRYTKAEIDDMFAALRDELNDYVSHDELDQVVDDLTIVANASALELAQCISAGLSNLNLGLIAEVES